MDSNNAEALSIMAQLANQNQLGTDLKAINQVLDELATQINAIPPETRKQLENFSQLSTSESVLENPLQALDYVKFSFLTSKDPNSFQNAYLIVNTIEHNLDSSDNNYIEILENLAAVYSFFGIYTNDLSYSEKTNYYNAIAYSQGSKTPMTILGYANYYRDKLMSFSVNELKRTQIYRDLAKLALEDPSGTFAYLVGSLIKGNRTRQYSYEKDDRKEALRWFKLAHNCGFLEGTCELGLYYLETSTWLPTNMIGINILENAAGKNYSEAQYLLGQCYLKGIGVKTNKKKAKEYLQQAAANGHQDAAISLQGL